MRHGIRLTYEQKIEIVRRICEQYMTDNFTIESCCNAEGIAESTFFVWRKQHPEIEEMYQQAILVANEQYKKRLKAKARTALEKRIEGFTYEEITQEGTATEVIDENGNKTIEVKPSHTRKVVKFSQPSDTAIIFALTNTDNENFKHRSEVHNTVSISRFEKMSDEELEKFIEEEKKRLELGDKVRMLPPPDPDTKDEKAY